MSTFIVDLYMVSNSEKIVAMFAKILNKKPAEVTPDKRIKEDLAADSLDVVELIMGIEEQFGVTVPDEAAEQIKTVGDLIKYVEKF